MRRWPAAPPCTGSPRASARWSRYSPAGLRYGEVAERLSISTRQVQRLAAQAVERAGVVNVCQLVASAVEAQLI